MRATARVVAARDRDGRTRLPVLRGESPLLLRRTAAVGDAAVVHLVGGAAGPLGGDRLRLEVEVGPGASLCLRTAAASIALPGRDGAPSRVEVSATVAPGGKLTWLPEPLVAAAGCRHVAAARIEVAAGGHLVWRDELVCGRHGEAPGAATVRLRARYAGRMLYQHELTVGPMAAGWSGPAVLAGARVTGSLLQVHPRWLDGPPPPIVLGPTAVLMPLAGPGVVATVTGPDAAAVRRLLDTATTHLLPIPVPDRS